jgi:hypothetical protein
MAEPDEIRESTFEKWGEQTCMPVSKAAGASSVYSFAMHRPVCTDFDEPSHFLWAHICQLFVGSAANTLTMCRSARFVVIAEAWWDCKMGFPSALEAIILWQLDL